MTRKTLAILAILGMLLISTFGTVAAQEGTGTDPVDEPTTESPFLTHPIVKLLGAYFGRDTGVTEPVDPADPPVDDPLDDPADPTDPTEPVETPVTPETVAAEIATYHEDGMGFGVLVKLYAMAEASRDACAAQAEDEAAVPAEGEGETEECTPLLVDDLVTEFKSGSGMGTLFKEYGKPALLGVGHVKKALKAHEQELEDGQDLDEPVVTDGVEKGKPEKAAKPVKPAKDKKNK